MIDVRREYLKTLRAVPPVLEALVDPLDADTARTRPRPGEWAVVEVVAHMADVDERAVERVERMLAEERPVLEPFDQAALAEESRYIERSLPAELERFSASRSRHVELLERLADDQWRRVGHHGEHGEISIETYEAHCAAEDVDHLAQVVSTLAALRREV